MSNNYAPCFNRIDFAVVLSDIELPWYQLWWYVEDIQGLYDNKKTAQKFIKCL